MARNPNFDSLSRDDIVLAVRDLVARGVVSAADVRDAAGRANRIAALEVELATLRGATVGARGPGRPRGAGRPAETGGAAPVAKPKRKITNTPQRLAAMRRQGQYLGALNKLSGADRARVKAVAKKEGVPAALALAARLLG
jgi:hypothetical protein